MAIRTVGPSGDYSTIRAALTAASNGDTIQIESGTYDITAAGYNNSLTYSATANCSTGFVNGVTSLTYDGVGNFGDASTTTITGNARLFQQNVDGIAPFSVTYRDLDFLYSGGSGYILSTKATNTIDITNVSFRGSHAGNASANGNYSDVRGVTNFNLSNSSVALTGQAGFNPGAGTGGSSFLLLQGGSGGAITITGNTFDEAGYRNALSIFDSVNVTISNNTFQRSSNKSLRSGGEKLLDTSATVDTNTFRDGAYLVLGNTSQPTRTSTINNNTFTGLTTAGTATEAITGGLPRGIVLESGNAAITGSTFTNNVFNYVSPIENKTATAITLNSMASNTFVDPITGTNKTFSSYYIGGTGSDTMTGTTAGEFFNAGAGSATINTGTGTAQDFILFNSPIGLGNIVTINNFGTNDRIILDRRIFAGIDASAASPLGPGNTSVNGGTGAVMNSNIGANNNQAQIRLVFNNGTGNLSYDPDGNGPLGSTLFAVINGSNLTGMNPAFNNRTAVNIGMI